MTDKYVRVPSDGVKQIAEMRDKAMRNFEISPMKYSADWAEVAQLLDWMCGEIEVAQDHVAGMRVPVDSNGRPIIPNQMKADLNTWLYGDFTPSQRDIDLYERLELYYRQTPDEMDNRTAMGYWKEFKRWCADRGYTQEEINRAKRNSGKEALRGGE